MDITMPITLRASVVAQTIGSFQLNLFGLYTMAHRLVANIDPIGDEGTTVADMQELLAGFFANRHVRAPRTAHFPRAFKWLWSQVKTEFFFHLEDDWVLAAPFDLMNMIEVMRKYPRLAQLRFPKFWATEEHCCQSQSRHEPLYVWNGDYYACPPSHVTHEMFFGSPSLVRTKWARGVLPHLHTEHCPEWQIRKLKKKHASMKGWNFGCYSRPGVQRPIWDIGTPWKRQRGLMKSGRIMFTSWKPIPCDTETSSESS